jgi:hypothetical protein
MSTPWANENWRRAKATHAGANWTRAISAMSLWEFLSTGILYSARGQAQVIGVWLRVADPQEEQGRRLAGARELVEPVPVRG